MRPELGCTRTFMTPYCNTTRVLSTLVVLIGALGRNSSSTWGYDNWREGNFGIDSTASGDKEEK
jgi:hypothetical protein